MSLADQSSPNFHGNTLPLPQNREKKATTEINGDQPSHSHGPNSNQNYQQRPPHSCFCHEIRLSRNNCNSKVVDFCFVPNSPRRSAVSPLPAKHVNFKNARTVTEPKSYTLNK